MPDHVKIALATAIFTAIQKSVSAGELTSWPAEMSRMGNLSATVTVRPEAIGPRRMFIVSVKEVM